MNAQRSRQVVQAAIAFILLYEGWQFSRFAAHFREGGPYVPRPPAVEAFLPISAIMGLKNWIVTGVYDMVHPAGLAILVAAVLTGILLHRGFCGWLCPVGTLSEYIGKTGIRLTARKFTPPKFVDWPLRLVKFILLGFFVKLIVIDMPVSAIDAFINLNPYNKVADVKMLDFWVEPTATTVKITGTLVIMSLFIQNAWCRYLCPYGAILIITGFLSPTKIQRDTETCIDCGKCTKVCPSYIDVQQKEKVASVECIKCFQCVSDCPVPGTLYMEPMPKRQVTPQTYGKALLLVFFGVLIWARLTGHWYSNITYEEYRTYVPIAEMLSH
jgi:polyferredoxin